MLAIRFFKNLAQAFEKRNASDPVKSCDVYRDKSIGSCVHVDGPLCDFPDCSILKNYKENKPNGSA
ncbi:hypothetical protein [Burkholderia phage FLC9]|nr:hypothetical protein [Burkholderia phage FLC9]